MASKVLRTCAWLSLLFLILVTLSPIGLRPITGLSVHIERFGAFAVVGLVFALAYPRRLLPVATVLILAAVSLEAMQLLLPGRHGRFFDSLVKILGAVSGLTAGAILPLLLQRLVRRVGRKRKRIQPKPKEGRGTD